MFKKYIGLLFLVLVLISTYYPGLVHTSHMYYKHPVTGCKITLLLMAESRVVFANLAIKSV